jgi:hypothetical protein
MVWQTKDTSRAFLENEGGSKVEEKASAKHKKTKDDAMWLF